MIYPGDDKDSELLDKDEGLKYEHFEQHKLISEELKLEPEEYIPTSCDKTCDQSHTVEVEDLGPDLEEDIEFQNSYTDDDKPNLGKSDQPTSSEEDDGSWILKLIDLSGLELISEELKLEPEEYIPTFCDKTCDQSHTVEVEDLGPDLEEDIEFQNSYTDDDKPNLGKSDQPTSSEEDDGSWILKLIDLSGLEKWSEDDKNAAIEMIKRNANVFSKNDMDMGRTNLVKHHIELTDPIPFKESYRRIPPQMYDEVKAHIQEMLDLGAIRHSNSPWSSAIVLVRKKMVD